MASMLNVRGKHAAHIQPRHGAPCPCRRRQVVGRCQTTDVLEERQIDRFLDWAAANGAYSSKTAILVGDNDERGVVAQAPIDVGELIVTVPLRLALTDHDAPADADVPLYAGAPWSVVLACQLLRQRALGERSAWAPFISVLPAAVPTPVNWPWQRISAVSYAPAAAHLHETSWVVEGAIAQLKRAHIGAEPGDAPLGEAEAELFRWAASIVHSRSFGSAGEDGGVGVRMLVPLADLFNHAGDQVASLYDSPVTSLANCRWDIAREGPLGGEWAMQVRATHAIAAGEEVCFSYGERGNDDMFVHYGFVPLRNPHDDVQLFADLEEALDWYYLECTASRYEAPLRMAADLAALPDAESLTHEMRRIAHNARKALQQRLASEDLFSAADSATADANLGSNSPSRLVAAPNAKITPELVSAFAALGGGGAVGAERAVARRCWEVLCSFKGTLLQDLALLARHSAASESEELPYWQFMLTHYFRAIRSFAAENGLEGTHDVVMADLSEEATSLLALADQCCGTAQRPAEDMLPYPEYLVHTLMVYKRIILWDILLRMSPLTPVIRPAPR